MIKINKRNIAKGFILLMMTVAVVFAGAGTVYAADAPADDLSGVETDQTAEEEIPAVTDPVDAFLAQSAFIGNSVGEGLTMYNNACKKVPLGEATMLTRVSYSFYADAGNMSKFLPRLDGTPMRAKYAIKESGAKYVFISMGTNDLVGSSAPESAFGHYQEYIQGIMEENPSITVFIESCTPTRPGSNVKNEKVTAFNGYMMSYCDEFPDMYYVDIATPLMDDTGYLASNLTSDGSVHLTMKAYAIWADTIRSYIGRFLTERAAAMKEERERALALSKANYEEKMRMVDDRKQEAFEARMQAKREAEAAEEARRREQLLTVPDEITIMHTLIERDNTRFSLADSAPVVASLGSIVSK